MEKNIFEESDLPELKKSKTKDTINSKVSSDNTKNTNKNRNNSNINDTTKNSQKKIIINEDNKEKLAKQSKNGNVEEYDKELPTEHVEVDKILERLALERQSELKKEHNEKLKKTKLKLRKWVWRALLVISLGVLMFSLSKIYVWHQENKQVDDQMSEIEKIIEVKEVEEEEKEVKIEQINPPKKENKNTDYWNYIKLPLISVDFDELLDKNEDTVAYLKVNGTNINYPVVQTKDNKYYLTHAFDKTSNSAGWVFMDYRNDANNLQDNTIIYAHGRVNTTMFGSLKNVFKSNWYENTDNYIVNLSTPKENTLWQVISVYQIPTETYYLTSSFGTKESKQKFIDTILKRSKYNFKAEVNTDDKILTLSTCANKTEKVVLHAKLIKKQVRN